MKLEVYKKLIEIVNQGNGMEALIVDKSKGLLVLKNKRKEEEKARDMWSLNILQHF